MHAAIAILAALVRRSVTGKGAFLDVAAAEGVLSLMSLSIDQYLATGEVAGPGKTLLTGRYAFYGTYECGDGRWLSVGAIESHFYANLCKALGLDQHISHQFDDAQQDEIRADFRKAFAQRTRDEWVAELAPRDTCVAPVYTIPELVEDSHFAKRRVFMQARDEKHGPFRQVSPVLAGCQREQPEHQVRPYSITDTTELLVGAGMNEQEIAKLRQAGVVE